MSIREERKIKANLLVGITLTAHPVSVRQSCAWGVAHPPCAVEPQRVCLLHFAPPRLGADKVAAYPGSGDKHGGRAFCVGREARNFLYQKKADPFYLSSRWKAARLSALQRDCYWCQRCQKRPANIVHHLVPRTVNPDLELELSNLQSVCSTCHEQVHPEKGASKNPGKQPDLTGIRVITMK